MEFLLAGFEIIEQEPGIEGIFKAAELPGRICYGSQDKMAPGTAERFVKGLMKSNHGAPLEHGTIYLKADDNFSDDDMSDIEYNGNPLDYLCNPLDWLCTNPYSKCKRHNGTLYVTTNLRVLFEHDKLNYLTEYLCKPTQYHEKRIMVRFTLDRFTGEEFLRHRLASFNRESTRYVLFTKEKFGGGSIKYIIPTWMLDRIDEINDFKNMSIVDFCRNVIDIEGGDMECISDIFAWEFALKSTEWSYNTLVNQYGWKAEQARTVLPCAISSPLIKTAFISDWIHFFKLRTSIIAATGTPHPQASELADALFEEFINRDLIEFDSTKKNITVKNL